MTKSEAIALFGGTSRGLADGLGVTPSRISQLPDGELDQATADRVIGAAVRLGKIQPQIVIPSSSQGQARA